MPVKRGLRFACIQDLDEVRARVAQVAATASSGAGLVPTSRQVLAGAGLNGGGALVANVTLNANLSTVATQDVAAAEATGTSNAVARDDHVHALPFATLQTVLGSASSTLGVNNQKITSLAAPTLASDAVNKAYADGLAAGLQLKVAVAALASTTIALSGLLTIDGVSLSAGNRVLVAGQGGSLTTPSIANGIYLAASGAWTRAADMAAGSHAAGAFAFVQSGDSFADTGWVCTTDGPTDVVGTNALQFTQFSATQSLVEGDGINIAGNVVSVMASGDGSITVGAGGVSVGAITDAQHGLRAGGALHAVAVANGAAGFLSGADKAKIDALPAAPGNLLLTGNVSLSQLQGAGAVAVATFNIGAALPANARLFSTEVQVTQAFAGTLLSAALATVQASADAAGSLAAALPLLTTGTRAGGGLNPYFSRGAQQIQVTITLTGALLNALTAGALTVRCLYTVV